MYSFGQDRLFPTKKSFFIFWSYVSLFVNQGILMIKLGYRDRKITSIIVLLTEFVKLCICVVVHLYRSRGGGPLTTLWRDLDTNRKLLLLYMVPAFLYCLYNNLSYSNVLLFGAPTYYCLLQFRIVLTAVIYQFLFKRQLVLIQWISLIILTAGCFIKEYGAFYNQNQTVPEQHQDDISPEAELRFNNSMDLLGGNITAKEEQSSQRPTIEFFWSTLLIIFQMSCSCFAGVYNEYLLKDSHLAKNADVILQNIFMYVDSIIFNLLWFNLPPTDIVPSDVRFHTILVDLVTSPTAILLIINNAMCGLVASFFLRDLNSILKTFASAVELFGITYFAWLLFEEHIDLYTVIALVLVSLATIIYARDPVSVAPLGQTYRDGFVLVPNNDD